MMSDHAHEMDHEAMGEHHTMPHPAAKGGGHAEHSQHQHMVADFRKRFWVSLGCAGFSGYLEVIQDDAD